MKIIGIDPGTSIFGYAIIQYNKPDLIIESVGVVQLNKLVGHYTKLKRIYEKVSSLINTYKPNEMAIEAPFYGENIQTMLKLGRAQGVAIAAAMMQDVEITEYSPRKIKQAITGNGNASKEQVAAMLQSQLKMDKLPKYFDATDALGVAVCHHLQCNSLLGKAMQKKGESNWKSFIQNNPDRIKK